MSSFDYDDGRHSHRYHDRRDRDDREPRYVETHEAYVRSPVAVPDPPYTVRTTEMVRRPVREDSDLSIEEVRRDFPPPVSATYHQRAMVRDDRYGPPVRSRSADRGPPYREGAYPDPRRSHNDLDDRRRRTYIEQENVKPRRRSLSRNRKIIAAVGGAALAIGGKELWDRKQADGRPISRNPLESAAVGAAGAFAAYEGAELYAKHVDGAKSEQKVKTYVAHRGRKGEAEEYYSSADEEPVKPKRSKSRRKSIVEGALGLAGLGAAAKSTHGSRARSRRGSDSDYDSRDRRDRSRSGRGRSPEGAAMFQQAAKAALLAGATEAFRVRNEPGGWAGDKGKRILTAAIGAGGIDAAADRDPDRKSKRHILEAVVGGLAGNRLINGSRNNIEDDGRGSVRSRSRSRSRSRGPGGGPSTGPLAALATAGLGAIAGKKLLDRSRSRSRAGGSRRRRYSSDSYDSRSPSPRRGDRKDRHKRSKSVTDYARNGLAALGLGGAAGAAASDRHRDRDVVEETTTVRKSRRGGGAESDYGGSRRSRDVDYNDSRDPYGDSRYAESRASNVGSRSGGRRRSKGGSHRNRDKAEGRRYASDSESSLGSSSGDEKQFKKMKGKQLVTAGLATIATIHAAHNVYQSMEKRDARRKAVAEGDMSPEEARKLKAKATLQDVASVGIAALGVKGAFSEIKEANEMRRECKELREKKEERHKRRLQRLQNGSNSARHSHREAGNEVASRRSERGPAPSVDLYDDYGPRYVDSNPYTASLPAPPVGYDRS
ncbi:hypothetical protein LZ554_005127 [Drepanopeziza brunnea f. sp. 'monogermtubi']|nr:hypothetical protein LZ554_005127 [Drepanopeziza brunnea f. sp. 'monogermtubi']